MRGGHDGRDTEEGSDARYYLLVTIVDGDDDRYANKRVDGDAKERTRDKGGRGTGSLFFVRENRDRGGYIRCIEQQGLTAFN